MPESTPTANAPATHPVRRRHEPADWTLYKTTRGPEVFSLPVYTSTIDWDLPMTEDDFLYRRQLRQLRKHKQGIARLVIIDFDNTLFKSPLPNPKLWDSSLIGMLMSTDLGWFHDARTLSPPYLQYSSNHWIEPVVQLVCKETARSDTLVVLLTGRSHIAYRKLVLGLLARRSLLSFDLEILKETPTRESPLVVQADDFEARVSKAKSPLTFDYKMTVVEDIISAFPGISEIAMWDDRVHQCEKMQHYLDSLKDRSETIDKAVIYYVNPQTVYMDHAKESELVHAMVDEYNSRVRIASLSMPKQEIVDGLPLGSIRLSQFTKYIYFQLDTPSRKLLNRSVRSPHGWSSAISSGMQLVCPEGSLSSDELSEEFKITPSKRTTVYVNEFATLPNRLIAVRARAVTNSSGDLIKPPEGVSWVIVVATNPANGAHAGMAKYIQRWVPLRGGELELDGTFEENVLTRADIVKRPVVQKTEEVSLGSLVCQFWPELQGASIGMAVREVRRRMEVQKIENSDANKEAITEIVRTLAMSSS